MIGGDGLDLHEDRFSRYEVTQVCVIAPFVSDGVFLELFPHYFMIYGDQLNSHEARFSTFGVAQGCVIAPFVFPCCFY